MEDPTSGSSLPIARKLGRMAAKWRFGKELLLGLLIVAFLIVFVFFPIITIFVLIALATAIFASGLAWVEERLPFSEATRARWKRERQLNECSEACRNRSWLWTGVGLLVGNYWLFGQEALNHYRWVFPCVCIAAGLVSYGLCYRVKRRNANP